MKQEERETIVYRWVHIPTGKVYAGITYDFEKRCKEHKRQIVTKRGGTCLIERAIAAHGRDQFTVEIVCRCKSREIALKVEAFLIGFHNSLAPNGYNIRGSSENSNEMADTTKKKLGQFHQGRQFGGNRYLVVVSSGRKFRTIFRINGKAKTRTFDTEIEGAEAYDKLALFVYGENARINFPEKREYYLSLDLQAFYDFYTRPSKPRKSKYKWIATTSAGWSPNVKNRGHKIPNFPIRSRPTQEEAAMLADQIIWAFLDYPIEKLNFPEVAKSYNKEALREQFLNSYKPRLSKYKHVTLLKKGKWKASKIVNGKSVYLGEFSTEEEAYFAVRSFVENYNAENTDNPLS